jgi:hypothetical protein
MYPPFAVSLAANLQRIVITEGLVLLYIRSEGPSTYLIVGSGREGVSFIECGFPSAP